MIRSVKSGLYAVNFGGGQVDITSGKFVFSATEAYLIEDGKITAPVKGATLIGNGPETMQKVTMIGNDLALDEGVGVCGKDGQSVPVGVGQPSLLIDEIDRGRHPGVSRRALALPRRRHATSRSAASLVVARAAAARAARGTARGTRAAACCACASSSALRTSWRRLLAVGVRDARRAARPARRRRRRAGGRARLRRGAARGFAARRFAAGIERIADRVQRFVVLAPHLLGQERELALARDVRGDAPGVADVRQQVFGNRQLRQLGRRSVPPAARASASTSSASRRCWLRLGPRNSPVSSSRPRIAGHRFRVDRRIPRKDKPLNAVIPMRRPRRDDSHGPARRAGRHRRSSLLDRCRAARRRPGRSQLQRGARA